MNQEVQSLGASIASVADEFVHLLLADDARPWVAGAVAQACGDQCRSFRHDGPLGQVVAKVAASLVAHPIRETLQQGLCP